MSLMLDSPREAEQHNGVIQKWQDRLCHYPSGGDLPLAADAYIHTARLYKEILKRSVWSNEEGTSQRRLKRALEVFLLWAAQHDMLSGGLGRALEHSRRLQKSVLKTLLSIGRILIERMVPRTTGPSEKLTKLCMLLRASREKVLFTLDNYADSKVQPESTPNSHCEEEDDASEASSLFEFDSLSEIAEDLTTKTNNLMDTNPIYEAVIENAPPYEVEEAADISKSASNPLVGLYSHKLKMRFPNATTELANYLGEMNYQRFVKGAYERQRNERLATSNGRNCGEVYKMEKKGRLHDSGVDTSIRFGGFYAGTAMSFHHDNGIVIEVPPIPAAGKKGNTFPCVACGKQVAIHNNEAWKQHLFSDLRPYNCLESSCRHLLQPFDSREDWVRHLAYEHRYHDNWPSLQCNLCFEETGGGEARVAIHLEQHLREIALAALPTASADDDESEVASDISNEVSTPATISEASEPSSTPPTCHSLPFVSFINPNGESAISYDVLGRQLQGTHNLGTEQDKEREHWQQSLGNCGSTAVNLKDAMFQKEDCGS
ncbi:hypothetical protein F4677DRAFT_465409 [Hypoxylon crocopeplum]|nr:hypothetical protein F4677DRAFT_465409 [Hypoxylon crocopeplum]